MKILGFSLTKVFGEKLKDRVENLKIGTKIDVSEITSAKADMLRTKEEILAIKFSYGLDYEPEFAKIELAGNMVISLEPKQARDVLSQWKNKQMPDDFRNTLFNVILRKASLKALQLEEELNIPLHFQPPILKIQDKKEEQH